MKTWSVGDFAERDGIGYVVIETGVQCEALQVWPGVLGGSIVVDSDLLRKPSGKFLEVLKLSLTRRGQQA